MSSPEVALASLVSHLALSFDGAVMGVALAYAAVRSIMKFTSASKALRKIRSAPTFSASDLRCILQDQDRGESQTPIGENELVIVRGYVEPKSTVDGTWKSNVLRSSNNSGVLVSHESGDKAVIIQRTQTCIYNEWKGIFGWTSDLRAMLGKYWKEQESTSVKAVPFVLAEGRHWPITDYVIVNLEGSRHPIPLTTVYHRLQPIEPTRYTFFQALLGHEYPIGWLDEVKILPLGKYVTAVGVCNSKNGIPEIKASKDLPYFLSDMTKDQMVTDLAFKKKVLLWSGIVLGSLSIGILGYAVIRNWNRWKEWRQQQRQSLEPSHDDVSPIDRDDDDDVGDVADGQLCVICLTRRRRAAFIPCGHLVCCQICSISVLREVSPKCPLCRQAIRDSIRIYDS